MSEHSVNQFLSSESLCSVIESSADDTKPELDSDPDPNQDPDHEQEHAYEQKKSHSQSINNNNSDYSQDSSTDFVSDATTTPSNFLRIVESFEEKGTTKPPSDGDDGDESLVSEITHKQEESEEQTSKAKEHLKAKKSVSFNPNDEKVRKFITGEPIIDQKNPFKSNGFVGNGSSSSSGVSGLNKSKRVPPPVPTKRSTLSIRKTVTQQLREREREKEKEKERLKNEANTRKSNLNTTLNSPDEYVTTEEVLKQSKYVKTYIKNPDPYFVYDPTVLARIKFEELREISGKVKPKKKNQSTSAGTTKSKSLSKDQIDAKALTTFKKCSKPNYPDLANIKIKVGTDSDGGNYFNPAEVTKNAKKFDERVKKLHISSDDDLDDIDEPLTKSESSDEVTNGYVGQPTATTIALNEATMAEKSKAKTNDEVDNNLTTPEAATGTFTNTIKSKEFQAYLEQKGLTLMPKKEKENSVSSRQKLTFLMPQTQQEENYRQQKLGETQSSATILSPRKDQSQSNNKKLSVFQRLLSNSIFTARRRTTPKETVPTPRPIYERNTTATPKAMYTASPTSTLKRVVLERQSYHGLPTSRSTNRLLSANEEQYLKRRSQNARNSFASGDSGIASSTTPVVVNSSSALGNSREDAIYHYKENNAAAVATQPHHKPALVKSKQLILHDNFLNTRSKMKSQPNGNEGSNGIAFQRTAERQSLIPRRITGEPLNKRQQQIFGRTASMDRNQILKRSAERRVPSQKHGSLDNSGTAGGGGASLRLSVASGHISIDEKLPQATSTPIREAHKPAVVNHTPLQIIDNQQQHVIQHNQPLTKQSSSTEWEKLRAIKELTDRELYYKVFQQQQQQQQSAENIYEHLQPHQVILQPQHIRTLSLDTNFVRGSPQRNTFSGVIGQHRQAKIIDGKPMLFAQYMPLSNGEQQREQPVRCQSVLDGMTTATTTAMNSGSSTLRSQNNRRGYESETETPVVLRRRKEAPPPRRIGGLLTRDEILEKVKEFCRKSLHKGTAATAQPKMQAIYERQNGNGFADLSPVSYASVETQHHQQQQQRPASQLSHAPQVPLRVHSLPSNAQQRSQQTATSGVVNTSSPIYAHVVKRSSLQSNHSELLYESPQQLNAQRTYAIMEQPTATTQYVLLDTGGEHLTPAQIVRCHQPTAAQATTTIYAQPQFVRTAAANHHHPQHTQLAYPEFVQLQEITSSPQNAGYHHGLRKLHDGRSTPLILDRSSQQASQIYWSPQHQRLQQANLLPIQISPRYMPKQVSSQPVPAPRFNVPSRAIELSNGNLQAELLQNIPNTQQMQQHQQYSPILTTTIPQQHQMQQQQQQQLQQLHLQKQHMQQTPQRPLRQIEMRNTSDWESGSEAGEVRRILEHSQQRDGKFKFSSRNR